MYSLLSVTATLNSIISILLAILVLLIMITVHEFGHYVVGKLFKFKINEFAIGMGPAIFKKTNKQTGEVFSIRALPLGGYCAFEGEDENSDSENAFNNKHPLKRIAVLVSGAALNLILGVFVLMLTVGIYGQLLLKIHDFKEDANYSEYSLVENDVILKIEDKTIYMSTDIIDALKGKSQGDVVKITVQNNGVQCDRVIKLRNDVTSSNLTDNISAFTAIGVGTLEKIVQPTENSGFAKGDYIVKFDDGVDYGTGTRIYTIDEVIQKAKTLSVGDMLQLWVLSGNERKQVFIPITQDFSSLTNSEVLNKLGIIESKAVLNYSSQNVKFGFGETLKRGFVYSFNVGTTIFRTLGELLTGKLGLEAMGGPITTITTTSSAIEAGGFNYFLEILGFIGINLAIFNLLPIPALDGSRVVFCLIEAIRKKPLNRKVEGVIHGVGLLVLLGFCILVDLLQIF
ncbi:MAG: RIP metalloprotease RseP [Clostridia bacterium]|nr:RIP metalloprotease RseP [Clostridia bacterium]